MTTNPNHNPAQYSLVPLEPDDVLEPIPWAHPAPEDGRLTPNPTHHNDWKVTYQPRAAAPAFPFAANNPNPAQVRAYRWPWVSVELYALGQVALAVAIAMGGVGPVTGIVVCLAWLLCGLALVAAQAVSENANPNPDDRHHPTSSGWTHGVDRFEGWAEPRRSEA
ncbi:MAG: hypothetical protein AAGA65_30700, partial [Actinomycetota bacterium]